MDDLRPGLGTKGVCDVFGLPDAEGIQECLQSHVEHFDIAAIFRCEECKTEYTDVANTQNVGSVQYSVSAGYGRLSSLTNG